MSPEDTRVGYLIRAGRERVWFRTTFEAATNAVIFNGTWIPGAGEHVQITYVAICFGP